MGNITIGQNISVTSVGGDATAVSAKDINITLNTAKNPELSIYGSDGSGTGKSIVFFVSFVSLWFILFYYKDTMNTLILQGETTHWFLLAG